MKRFLMTIGDGPFSGTGFSEELRNILYRLVQTGDFDVSWLALQYHGFPTEIPDLVFQDVPQKNKTITMYGNHGDPYSFGASAFLKHYRTANPEMVMFMGDPRHIRPYLNHKTTLGFPLIFYVTLDGLPIHPYWAEDLKYVNLLITMTEWAQKEYRKVGLSPAMIHHGINWKWWQVDQAEKIDLRHIFHIPDDAVVFVNWDIPQHRKRTDALLRCWRDFIERDPKRKAILLLFCDWKLGNSLGYDVEGLIRQYNVPKETIVGPIEIQGAPKYWECPETPDQLKKAVMIGDVYYSTTSGEGFGKCGLEAMAMGMPTIITDYAASSEVHQKGSILVPCYKGRQGRFRLDDRRRSVEAGVIDEGKVVEALELLYNDEKKRRSLGREANEWAKEFDYDSKIVPEWKALLEGLDTDLLAAKELLQI